MAGPAIRVLYASPSGTINVGPAPVGPASVNQTQPEPRVMVQNTGNQALTVTAVTLTDIVANPGDFTYNVINPLPQTIAPGASVILGSITCLPTRVAGTTESTQLNITSNAIAGVHSYTVECTAANAPTAAAPVAFVNDVAAALGAFPSYDLGDVLATQVLTFDIKVRNADNVLADGNITVNCTALTAKGYSVSPASVSIAPGGLGVFHATLTVPAGSGVQDDLNSFSFTVTSGAYPFTFETFYSVAAFTPAFSLTGSQEQSVLALDASSVSTASYYNPAGTLNDEAILLQKQYYIDQPHLNKMLNRIWLLFERVASFVLSCVASTLNPKNQPSTVLRTVANIATDGQLNVGVFDLQLTGSVITVTYSMPANTGQFSLVGFVFKVDEVGEVIENT